jgi:hypothetical protein
LRKSDGALNDYERELLEIIFKPGESARFSQLRTRSKTVQEVASAAAAADMINAGLLPSWNTSIRTRSTILAGLFAAITMVCYLYNHTDFAFGCLLTALILKVSAGRLPAKTLKGLRVSAEANKFISRVGGLEQASASALAKEDASIFARFLPYALALEVEDKWCLLFDDLETAAPEWLVSSKKITATTLQSLLLAFPALPSDQ